jgi:hypothetical protein
MIVPLIAVAVLAVACGSDDDNADDASSTTETTETTELTAATDFVPSTDEPTTVTFEDDYPCSLFDLDELGTIIGNSLDQSDGITNNVTEDDVSYVGQQCNWSSSTGEGNELIVQVSEADDFPSGSVECPPTIGDATIVTGVGNSADYQLVAATELEVGTLRVCSDDSFVIVSVDGPVGEDHQQMAVAIAELTLSALA